MQKTGAAQAIVDGVLRFFGQAGSTTVLAVIYLLATLLTAFMSNNAAAVLLAPVAIVTAAKLGVDAKPFLIAVTFAASTCFATPVGYQTNMMVYNAGGYCFKDFMKVGIPLNIIFWALAFFFIPRFWPM
jgi:di/tricarboxylate transporter